MHDVGLEMVGPRWLHLRLRSHGTALHCSKCLRLNSSAGAYDPSTAEAPGEGEHLSIYVTDLINRRAVSRRCVMAGPIKSARARSSGTLVQVWRSVDFGDEQSAPWVTVCEHGSICEHDTRKLALDLSAAPEEWCETGCRHAAEGRKCPGCGSKRMDFHGDNWICEELRRRVAVLLLRRGGVMTDYDRCHFITPRQQRPLRPSGHRHLPVRVRRRGVPAPPRPGTAVVHGQERPRRVARIYDRGSADLAMGRLVMKHTLACAGFVLLVLTVFWLFPMACFYIFSPLGMP
jgi:hypothetical protein